MESFMFGGDEDARQLAAASRMLFSEVRGSRVELGMQVWAARMWAMGAGIRATLADSTK